MTITTQQLRVEVEAVAKATGLSPATIGRRVGQGGRFYARLCAGKRMWPDTIARVHEELQKLRGLAPCEASHTHDSSACKGAP